MLKDGCVALTACSDVKRVDCMSSLSKAVVAGVTGRATRTAALVVACFGVSAELRRLVRSKTLLVSARLKSGGGGAGGGGAAAARGG